MSARFVLACLSAAIGGMQVAQRGSATRRTVVIERQLPSSTTKKPGATVAVRKATLETSGPAILK